jgi:hypothetical protein
MCSVTGRVMQAADWDTPMYLAETSGRHTSMSHLTALYKSKNRWQQLVQLALPTTGQG